MMSAEPGMPPSPALGGAHAEEAALRARSDGLGDAFELGDVDNRHRRGLHATTSARRARRHPMRSAAKETKAPNAYANAHSHAPFESSMPPAAPRTMTPARLRGTTIHPTTFRTSMRGETR